jgi:hypothetical protein
LPDFDPFWELFTWQQKIRILGFGIRIFSLSRKIRKKIRIPIRGFVSPLTGIRKIDSGTVFHECYENLPIDNDEWLSRAPKTAEVQSGLSRNLLLLQFILI